MLIDVKSSYHPDLLQVCITAHAALVLFTFQSSYFLLWRGELFAPVVINTTAGGLCLLNINRWCSGTGTERNDAVLFVSLYILIAVHLVFMCYIKTMNVPARPRRGGNKTNIHLVTSQTNLANWTFTVNLHKRRTDQVSSTAAPARSRATHAVLEQGSEGSSLRSPEWFLILQPNVPEPE